MKMAKYPKKNNQWAKLENRLGLSAVIKSLEYKSSPPNTKKGTREMINYEATFTDLFTEEQKQYWKEETTKWAQQWADDIDKQILEDVLRQLGQL